MSEWKDDAYAVIENLAQGERITSDDVLEAVGHPDPDHAPNARNNAVGSVFGRASRSGIIRQVGTSRSRQPHRKSGLVLIWERT